jgi:hypothetical protein
MPRLRKVRRKKGRAGELTEGQLEFLSTGFNSYGDCDWREWIEYPVVHCKADPIVVYHDVPQGVWKELRQVWLDHRPEVEEYNRQHFAGTRIWAEDELAFASYHAWVAHEEAECAATAEGIRKGEPA